MDQLSLTEARVLGVLLEKQITTPDQYPLSLNALTTGCNQKSSREPVMKLTEAEVLDSITGLISKHMAVEENFAGRVAKYKHRYCNTEFGKLKFSEQELGILCLMLLRGAQTPGELRSRSGRLCSFNDVAEVESVLANLTSREDGPFVQRLEREPGKREARYQQLIAEEVGEHLVASSKASGVESPSRLEALENRIETLETLVERLQEQLEELIS